MSSEIDLRRFIGERGEANQFNINSKVHLFRVLYEAFLEATENSSKDRGSNTKAVNSEFYNEKSELGKEFKFEKVKNAIYTEKAKIYSKPWTAAENSYNSQIKQKLQSPPINGTINDLLKEENQILHICLIMYTMPTEFKGKLSIWDVANTEFKKLFSTNKPTLGKSELDGYIKKFPYKGFFGGLLWGMHLLQNYEGKKSVPYPFQKKVTPETPLYRGIKYGILPDSIHFMQIVSCSTDLRVSADKYAKPNFLIIEGCVNNNIATKIEYHSTMCEEEVIFLGGYLKYDPIKVTNFPFICPYNGELEIYRLSEKEWKGKLWRLAASDKL